MSWALILSLFEVSFSQKGQVWMLQEGLKKLHQLLTQCQGCLGSRSDWQGGQQGQLGCRSGGPGRAVSSSGPYTLGRLEVPADAMKCVQCSAHSTFLDHCTSETCLAIYADISKELQGERLQCDADVLVFLYTVWQRYTSSTIWKPRPPQAGQEFLACRRLLAEFLGGKYCPAAGL